MFVFPRCLGGWMQNEVFLTLMVPPTLTARFFCSHSLGGGCSPHAKADSNKLYDPDGCQAVQK